MGNGDHPGVSHFLSLSALRSRAVLQGGSGFPWAMRGDKRPGNSFGTSLASRHSPTKLTTAQKIELTKRARFRFGQQVSHQALSISRLQHEPRENRKIVPISVVTYKLANRVQSPALSLQNFRKWETCRTMPLAGGFSRGSSVPPPLHSGTAPFSPHFTNIGSQDLVVNRSPKSLNSTQLLLAANCKPPIKANPVQFPALSLPDFRMWESCRCLAGFLRDLSFLPSLHSVAAPYSPRSTLIGSQDLDVKSRPDLSTHSLTHSRSEPCALATRVSVALMATALLCLGRGKRVQAARCEVPQSVVALVALQLPIVSGDSWASSDRPPTEVVSRDSSPEPISDRVMGTWMTTLSDYFRPRCVITNRPPRTAPSRHVPAAACSPPPLPFSHGAVSRLSNRIRLPAGLLPGFSHVGIVPDDAAASRRVFSEIFLFPHPCIPTLLHIHLASSSSTLDAPLLRAKTYPLHFLPSSILHDFPLCRGGGGGTLAERLTRSLSTKANRVQYPTGSPDFRKCKSYRTMPAGFLGDLPFPPPLHSGAAPYSLQSPSSALKTSLSNPEFASRLLASHQREPSSIPGRFTLDFRKWESCRTMPLVDGFSRDLPVSPPFHSGAAPSSPHFIAFQDLAVKNCPNLFTHSPNYVWPVLQNFLSCERVRIVHASIVRRSSLRSGPRFVASDEADIVTASRQEATHIDGSRAADGHFPSASSLATNHCHRRHSRVSVMDVSAVARPSHFVCRQTAIISAPRPNYRRARLSRAGRGGGALSPSANQRAPLLVCGARPLCMQSGCAINQSYTRRGVVIRRRSGGSNPGPRVCAVRRGYVTIQPTPLTRLGTQYRSITAICRQMVGEVVTATRRQARVWTPLSFVVGVALYCERVDVSWRKRVSYKGYTGTRYKGVIIAMRKALNGLAVFSYENATEQMYKPSCRPGISKVGIVPDDVVRRVFSGISCFPPPFSSGAAPYAPQSLSSALTTSTLRAVQMSSLPHSLVQAFDDVKKCSVSPNH
ncbi:hypothetical protein PR048_003224 [Dryococelus australis]|uniref:Uncharacterized protein n=1 Tax=Dryococelus australis TaxID=614101 RepID=A0ABQ9IMF5_9NEOP|nr:hypothetical protein PR048_003224 [Dryococelus australis]